MLNRFRQLSETMQGLIISIALGLAVFGLLLLLG